MVLPLFRSQVVAQGSATYFGAQSLHLDVTEIMPDQQQNYLNAFAAMSTVKAELFGDADSKQLIEELYS